MSRIKKRGLDYFPLNTDFMHDRLVRRIMKREGDGSFAILLGALSCIYADEGYYVCADELFYEDLSACLYEKTAADVKRILALAVGGCVKTGTSSFHIRYSSAVCLCSHFPHRRF